MMRKNFYEVFGYTNPMECMILQRFGAKGVCLEVGPFLGKSTIAMAEVAQLVYTVDTFKSDDQGERQLNEKTTYDAFMENIAGYNNIIVVEGLSYIVIPPLDIQVDFVFLDGLLDELNTERDIQITWPKLKMGGTLALHDYLFYKHPAVRKMFVKYFGEPEGVQDLVCWTTKTREEL